MGLILKNSAAISPQFFFSASGFPRISEIASRTTSHKEASSVLYFHPMQEIHSNYRLESLATDFPKKDLGNITHRVSDHWFHVE